MVTLLNLYLFVSVSVFLATAFNRYYLYDNYFAFALSYWADPMTNVLLYNTWLALMILSQKLVVKLIFSEMKENEKTKIMEKLKLKSLEILFMAVILHDQFTFPVFALALSLVVSFILHHLTVLRSEYLINTHNLYLGEHLKLLSFYLVLLFVDFEVLKQSWTWIASQNNMSIVFSFYVLQLLLLLLEPVVKFSIYLYERFTGFEFLELDAKLNVIGLAINLPRLLVLNLLGLWIMFKFRFSFFFVFMIIELVVELLQLLRSFSKIRGLSRMMQSLPKITREEIERQKLDDTCMVCFREIYDGILVPSCNHIFHNECLKQWIHKNTNHFCPKCKKQFSFPDKVEEQVNTEQQQPLVEPEVDNHEDREDDEDNQGQQRNQQVYDFQPSTSNSTQRLLRRLKDLDRGVQIDQTGQGQQKEEQVSDSANQEQRPISKKNSQKESRHNPSKSSFVNSKRVGSLAFCLPSEAIYNRNPTDFSRRKSIKLIHRAVEKVLQLPQPAQMLVIPHE